MYVVRKIFGAKAFSTRDFIALSSVEKLTAAQSVQTGNKVKGERLDCRGETLRPLASTCATLAPCRGGAFVGSRIYDYGAPSAFTVALGA